MIERDPLSAARQDYDLIVIGGGIYGVSLTLEAARRGLAVLMVEQDDFGARTSWNSLRIVHGGLRYLQSADLHRFRESVAERKWWLRHFPDLVRPLPCLMPLYNEGLRRPIVLRLALWANDLLSLTRNKGVPSEAMISAGRVLGVKETLERFPDVDCKDLRGSALWYDAAMPDSQRLIIEMLHWAAACGAVALNYVSASRLRTSRGRVAGLEAVDVLSRRSFEFRAETIVNCAGPWCRQIATSFDRDLPRLFRSSLGFNVLLDREAVTHAALAVTPCVEGGRTYFLHPWKGKILAGTFHAECAAPDDEKQSVDEALVQRFLEHLNMALPSLELSRSDVLRVHWGFLPTRGENDVEPATREVIVHHGDLGGPRGLFSVSGVKFTTARRVAEKVLEMIGRVATRARHLIVGISRPEPVQSIELEAFERLLDADEERAAAHVRGLVEQEAVQQLDDLLLRRTDWGMDPRKGQAIAARVKRLLGGSSVSIAHGIEPATGSNGRNSDGTHQNRN